MLWILIGVMAAVIAVCLLDSWYERYHFRIVRETVVSSKIGPAFDGYKVVMLSDLHNNSFGDKNERLLSAIDRLKPDAVMIAGDMIVAKGVHSLKVPLHLIGELSGKYPVYYANGNHETRLRDEREIYGGQYEEYTAELKKLGVHLLIDESVTVCRGENRLGISGLELDKYLYKGLGKAVMEDGYMNKKLGPADKRDFHILLAHSPLYFEEYAAWGADLVFAGHFHGGTIRIPFLGGVMTPNYMFFPQYDAGTYRQFGSVMVLSSGLGTHSINIRLNNRPQLICVELKGKEGDRQKDEH